MLEYFTLLRNGDRIHMAELISTLALSRFEPPSPLLRVLAYHLLPFATYSKVRLSKERICINCYRKEGFSRKLSRYEKAEITEQIN